MRGALPWVLMIGAAMCVVELGLGWREQRQTREELAALQLERSIVLAPPSLAAPSPVAIPPVAPIGAEPRVPTSPGPGPDPVPEPAPAQAPMPETLTIPVSGKTAEDLADSFADPRTGHLHEAIDIMAAKGTPVIAVADGTIEKLFESAGGGLTIYQFDPGKRFAYYYAHLDRYAGGIAEGKPVRRGEVIAYVGHSGNARPDAPHLHFAIFRLDAKKRWWKGTAINPYPLLARED